MFDISKVKDLAKNFTPTGQVLLGIKITAIVLAIGLILHQRSDIKKLNASLTIEQANHKITTQSLNTLSDEMAKLVNEGKIRQERLDTAMAEVAEEVAPLKAAVDKIEKNGLDDDYVTQLKKAGL